MEDSRSGHWRAGARQYKPETDIEAANERLLSNAKARLEYDFSSARRRADRKREELANEKAQKEVWD